MSESATPSAPQRDALLDLAFAAALALVAVSSFRSSYGGYEFLILGAIGVLLGASVAYFSVRSGFHSLAVVLFTLCVYVFAGGTIALHRDATAGFVPSPRTISGAVLTTVVGWKQLLTTVPPVGRVGDLLVLPMFSGMVSVTLSYLAARRLRSVIACTMPPTLLLGVGILCGIDEPVSVAVHGAMFAVLVLGWLSLRQRRTQAVIQTTAVDRRHRFLAGALLVVAASVVGMVLGPGMPFVSAKDRVILRDTVQPPFDPFDYPSPLASYRRFIKPLDTTSLFTIEGLPEGVPVRLATMDDYDGVVWRVTGGAGVQSGASGYFERVGTEVDPQFAGATATVRVTIGTWSDVWLPTVGEVVSLKFEGPRARELNDAFRYNRATDTAAVQSRRLQPGDSYVMKVALPPTAESVTGGALVDDRTTSSNEAVPDALTTWAAPVVQKIADPYERVIALADELRNGYYSDGELDQLDSLGGHSAGRLTNMVDADVLVGNAEQYAASLGLMLRGIDIPSRVVMGFWPHQWRQGPIEVTGVDTEAWVETPMVDVGWVQVRETPPRDRNRPKEAPKPKPTPERNTQVPPPPPVLVEDPRSVPAKESAGQQDAPPPDLPEDGGPLLPTPVLIALAIAVPPAIVIGGAIAVIVGLKARRRRRRRRGGSPTERVSNGFREIVDAARDLGRPVPDNSTRREVAGFVGAGRAGALATAADSLVFRPEPVQERDVTTYWSDVDEVIKEMRHDVGAVDRFKARLSLVSLRGGRS